MRRRLVPMTHHRDGTAMIQLTRLNNQTFMVNSDLIKFVERSPDTVITLVTGEKIIVRDSVEEVLARILHFRRLIVAGRNQSLCEQLPCEKG